MSTDLLKPLAAFCTQSISQRYIKTVRNLGDLAEQPEHVDSAVIETTFGLNLKIRKDFNNKQHFFAKLDIPSLETASQDIQSASSSPRYFRIFPDYGTDFIWLDKNDPEYDQCYIDPEDAFSGLPKSLAADYDAWVETYTTNFEERFEETGYFPAQTFPTVVEEVAWNVTGFLLAWRIVLAPYVGSVEFDGGGRRKYLLRKGKDVENDMIYSFLEEQAMFLERGHIFQ
ncbi:hypothetical protein TMatcc_007438 [Talaromyces marneffei ATCC 18224]|uniref:uncharacterized protein n=1 Tax=Talaromyces marneffei TaxID=37727 RepID=UPI0012A98E37|nr:uncharacterized protein EYB26_004399 [Talaromyces marneffei]KAE8553138.1 hypothetical protein EYB25_004519 [Talaromyces marneffei]QGA16731.1 hypothetical protein EYB26_004399 [Talaromyces marneffei]